MSLIGNLLHFVFERRASNTNLDELRRALDINTDLIYARIDEAADTPKNREAAAHIVGIERWGDHRLRVAMGEPYVQDEYDQYRPSTELTMPQLAIEFRNTRLETLALVDQLHPYEDKTVPHNDAGPLSIRAWLVYLNGHSDRESRRITKAMK